MSRPTVLKKRVKQIILDEIKQSGLKPGDRIKGELEYAAQLNVSRMTANKAIKELENEGIVERRKGSGSFVSQFITPARNAVTEVVYLWDGYTSKAGKISTQERTLHALEMLCGEFSFKLRNITYTYSQPHLTNNFSKMIDQIISNGTQAVLIQSHAYYADPDLTDQEKKDCQEAYFESLYLLRESGIPFVVLDHMGNLESYDHSPWDVVTFNSQQMGAKITRHLWMHGHRNLGVVGYDWSHPWQTQRLTGCRRTLKTLGKELPDTHVFTLFNPNMPPQKLLQTKEREFWAWFRKIKPSALICINDKLAFTLIDMLKKNNINIPKDLSITGFDNLNWHSNSELTTIDFSMEEPVRVALAMLHKRLNEPKRTRTDSYIMIEPRIIERFSVDFHSS